MAFRRGEDSVEAIAGALLEAEAFLLIRQALTSKP